MTSPLCPQPKTLATGGTARRGMTRPQAPASRGSLNRDTYLIWGVPFTTFTRAGAADAVIALAEGDRPSYFITANTHYALLSNTNPELAAVNERAAFIVADGKPIVWASQAQGTPLPERVAGSDLIFDVCERAAARGMSVYLLGAEPGVARAAGERLAALYPGLRVVGAESTPYRDLTPEEHQALLGRVHAAAPNLLFLAFGQPKGEVWLAKHVKALGVPACVQLGATLDFVAGRVRRAPVFFQKVGLEWAFRAFLEPGRLAPRYAADGLFVLKMLWRSLQAPAGQAVVGRPSIAGSTPRLLARGAARP